MATRRLSLVYALMALLAAGFLPSAAPGQTTPQVTTRQTPAELGPYDIRAAKEVDETLFLFYVLNRSFDEWPDWGLDSNYAANWAVDQKLTLKRLRAYANGRNLGAEVINSLDEAIGVFDAYDEYLVEIGAASRETLARARKERGELFEAGVKTLADRAQKGTYSGDGGTKQAVGETAVAAGVGLLIDLYNQGKREEAEQQRKSAAERSFKSTRDSARMSIARTATRLASQKGWAAGEVGFDNLGQNGAISRRPRDPFARLKNAVIRMRNEKAADLIRDMRQCMLAAQHVPDGSVYDQFRAEMLVSASDLAASAASRWWFENGHSYKSQVAEEGIRICRTRLQYDPDVTDVGKYELAQCLNFSGRHQEALGVAVTAKRQFNEPGFAYDLSCMSSINGLNKQSLDWLARAFSLGNTDVEWSRNDPDLANMRKAFPAEFRDLTQVKLSGNIVWGVFNDDYTITNNSKFTITNLTVKPIIVRKDRRTYKELYAARIAPGETYTWDSVFSISKEDFVEFEFGEWDCDQKDK